MRFWLAGLVGIIVTGALVAVGTVDTEAAGREEEVAMAVPTHCERYGEMTERIVEARSPKPKADARPALIADDGGYTGIPIYWNLPISKMSWWCDEAQLTVRVKGPRILDATDIPSALENLIRDLRAEGLDPQVDGVGIVLEAMLHDGSARFDPAEAMCLEEIARHAEVRDNGYSLGTALGATGELPPVYGEQWVPMIGVLVPRPEREVPMDADARARALEACIPRKQPNR